MVGQRTREIGVKTALGARIGQIVWEIARQGFVLTAFGTAFGVLASLGVGRVLESQLYQVSKVDPASMIAGSLALGLVALLASLIPAGQAARVDPVVALRNE
jgi:ABC-type antimicrobial peptide transport system permease subunit